ncbi:hypothetical protein STEG23_031887 [Scotinomys teguina]
MTETPSTSKESEKNKVHAGCREHKAGRTEGAGREPRNEARPVRPGLQRLPGRDRDSQRPARQRHPCHCILRRLERLPGDLIIRCPALLTPFLLPSFPILPVSTPTPKNRI